MLLITIPGSGGGATVYGEGIYGEGVYGGGGSTTIEMRYPIVDAPHWSGIREGDFVRLIAPGANLRGAAPLCRVLSRTFGDAHLIPRLKLVSVPQWTAQTLPVARVVQVSYQPPQTVERRLVELAASQGPAIDAARLRSQLAATQVPALSSLNGTVTDAQVPGFVSRDATLSTHDTTLTDHEARIAALEGP